MRTINNLLEAVKKIDLLQAIDNSLDAKKKDYVDLQKDQLFHGLRSDGESITPFYTRFTIAIKKEKGQVTDRVTLRDTGAFYDGIYADPRSEGLVVDSSDEKTDMLTKKYSDAIFTLEDERKQLFANLTHRVLIEEIEKQMA